MLPPFQEYIAEVQRQAGQFVLMGHSRGSLDARRLVQRVVEPSAALEGQLRLAILAGELGDLYVPSGKTVGGSFVKTPLCTSNTQRGCVLTFNTFALGEEPTSTYPDFAVPSGMDVACTNPAALGGGVATLADTLFLTQFKSTEINPPQTAGVSTPFASMAAFYTGQCVKSAGGYSFFEIDPSPGQGDERTNPIPFTNVEYTPTLLGLHLLDYAFPMGDLLAAVKARQ